MSTNKRSSLRRAFTLVELLVVIGIIGVLISITLPAVQKAREAARKTACGNQLKQIGVAMHSYLTSFSSFPPGYISGVLADHDDAGPGWSWGAMLLPFLEQTSLYNQVPFTKQLADPASDAVRSTSVASFLCPSDPDFKWMIDVPDKSGKAVVCRIAASNYVACAGTVRTTCKICRDNFDGMFGRNRAIKPSDIKDGFSQTLAAGERAFHWSSPAMWGVVTGSRILDRQVPGKYAAGPAYVLGTTFKEGFNIEEVPLDADEEHTFAESFGSRHPGGSHFLFCDGGARFVWENADPAVMNSLSTRSGNPKQTESIIHASPF